MKIARYLVNSSLSATGLIVLSFLTVASALPTPEITVAPRLHNASTSSLNWSGYAVTGPTGSVSDARGSWIVPAISSTCPSTNQFSSFWVGIDGFTSGTVEQTGTDSDCRSGAPTYFAWFEFFPHPLFTITTITVSPGDHISAEVNFNGRFFVVTITDTTTAQTFSTSSRVSRAQRSSAEWIAEAPSSSGGILPLADFGTVSYGVDNTGVSTTCYATIGGTTGPIGSFGSSVQQITMVSNSGAVKASPSSLSSDGTSFSVVWVSSGP